MPDITLVRCEPGNLTDQERALLHRVLFGMVDGLGDTNKKRWRGFWRRVLRLEPGEMVEIKTHQARLGSYHNRHMAFEQAVFAAQERFDNFDRFRDWLKVGAGHCTFEPHPCGGTYPRPDSTSYAQIEQGAMEIFHDNTVEFLRSEDGCGFLWPHLSSVKGLEMLEACLVRWGWE